MSLPQPATSTSFFRACSTRREWFVLGALLATVVVFTSLTSLQRTTFSNSVLESPPVEPPHNTSIPQASAPRDAKVSPIPETKVKLALSPSFERQLDPHASFVLPKDFYRPYIPQGTLKSRHGDRKTVDLYTVLSKCEMQRYKTQSCLDFLEHDTQSYLVERDAIEAQGAKFNSSSVEADKVAYQRDPMPCNSNHPLLYHAYWRGLMHETLIWALKSFLFTQNLNCSRFVLWIDSSTPTDWQHIESKLNSSRATTSAPVTEAAKAEFEKWQMHSLALREALSFSPFIIVKRFNLSEVLWTTLRLPASDEIEIRRFLDQKHLEKLLGSEDAKKLLSSNVQTLLNSMTANRTTELSTTNLRFNWPVSMMMSTAALVGNSVSDSDLVRFLLLDTYGGLYVDTDVVFLRDLRPWFNSPANWAYSWSYFNYYNTAFLRFNGLDEEPDALKMWRLEELKLQKPTTLPLPAPLNTATLPGIVRSGIAAGMQFHPHHILTFLKGKPHDAKKPDDHISSLTAERQLAMLPSSVFDSLWRYVDGAKSDKILPTFGAFSGIFATDSNRALEFQVLAASLGKEVIEKADILDLRTIDRFFPGSPAYHIHKITQTIQPDSWAHVLLQHYNCFLTSQCPNIYGEWLPSSWAS